MSEINREKNGIIVRPGRDIVASMVSEFSEELRQLMQESPRSMIIDLSGVKMVDSLGMGALIAAHNALFKAEGKLKVINVAKDIYAAFTTMRLDHHFAIEPAEQDT